MPPDENNQASTTTNQPSQNQPANPPPPSASTPPQQPAPVSVEPSVASPQEPPTPTAAPQQNQTPPQVTYPKSTKRLFFSFLTVLLLITIVAFTGGIALAYTNYPLINPPKTIKNALDKIIVISPFPKPTRIILESAVAKSANLKSADQKTEISLSTNSASAPISSVRLTLTGPIDLENQDKQAAEVDIALEVKMEGTAFNGSASIKTVKNTLYFKINEIPFGQIYQQLLDFKGKWYYWEIPNDYIPTKEEIEQNEKINEILVNFVEATRNWTTITSKDGSAYTLEIDPPKEEVAGLIHDVINAYQPKEQAKIDADLEKEEISKVMDKIEDLKIVAKVNKDNYYLSKIDISFNVSTDNFSLPIASESLTPQEQLTFKFNLSTELSNYNKQVVIIPPDNAINIMDAYGDLLATYQNQIPTTDNLALPPELSPSPSPSSITEEDLNKELDGEQSLQDLIAPDESVLGDKYSWEQELLKLFTGIVK